MTTYKQANPYAQPRCEICRFCIAPGRCHRYPPVVLDMGEFARTIFPLVDYSDWCGEFKLDYDALKRIEADAKKREQP